MAAGFASAAANTLLDYFITTVVATPFLKLHTGDPGAAATSNAAGETTRKAITFSSAAAGSKASSGALTWTNVASSETYSFGSIWTASSAGTFEMSGTITANAVTAGDTFTIASAGLTITLSVAA